VKSETAIAGITVAPRMAAANQNAFLSRNAAPGHCDIAGRLVCPKKMAREACDETR